MPRQPDYRSEKAKAYRHLYKTKRWLQRRAAHLAANPLCERCKAQGRLTAATVAHHRVEHKGDEALFVEGELESLCKTHHDSLAQAEEKRGYVIGCDAGGRPLDPAHPWNRTPGGV